MNRATKRLLAKQEAAAQRAQKAADFKASARTRVAQDVEREGRLKRWRRFLKEVRQELKKVAWPTRGEVFTYTVVVLVSVSVVTLFVFVLDFLFARGLFEFYGTG